MPITLIDTLPDADDWWNILATHPAHLPTLPPPVPTSAIPRIPQPPGRPLAHVTDPFDLEVHRPIHTADHGSDLPALPRYVRRAHDDQLAAIAAQALAGHSVLAVLVGGSSTGKTRACWEALTVLSADGLGDKVAAGLRELLPYQLLAEAAPGYLTDTEWNDVGDDWLEAVLVYCR
ncbi:hypothetical protein GCM10022252_68370 [Streptosporangium oxazolinicum]|uniref:Uncharacterized protein n=1 Tax=Streptosporangium oxazolinicum TaxID=909287 RepID=A0ABP8BGP3_9ACTN